MIELVANSSDPDQMLQLHSSASGQGLHSALFAIYPFRGLQTTMG